MLLCIYCLQLAFVGNVFLDLVPSDLQLPVSKKERPYGDVDRVTPIHQFVQSSAQILCIAKVQHWTILLLDPDLRESH